MNLLVIVCWDWVSAMKYLIYLFYKAMLSERVFAFKQQVKVVLENNWTIYFPNTFKFQKLKNTLEQYVKCNSSRRTCIHTKLYLVRAHFIFNSTILWNGFFLENIEILFFVIIIIFALLSKCDKCVYWLNWLNVCIKLHTLKTVCNFNKSLSYRSREPL